MAPRRSFFAYLPRIEPARPPSAAFALPRRAPSARPSTPRALPPTAPLLLRARVGFVEAALSALAAVALTAPPSAWAESPSHPPGGHPELRGDPPTATIPAQGAVPRAERPEPQPVALGQGQGAEAWVRQALERAPSLAALRARVASAREQAAPAGALPDPVLGIMLQSMGPPWDPMPPMSMGQIELTQALPSPGKRGARRAAAEAEALVRAASLDELRARLAADVRTAYARLFALDHERSAVAAALALTDLLGQTVAGRYGAGQGDQEEVIKVELERAFLAERTADLDADRAMLLANLARLAGLPEPPDLPTVDALDEPALEDSATADRALENAPEVRTGRADVLASARRTDAARAEGRPNFLVGLAGGSTTTGDPVLTVRLGVELPVWRHDKQGPLLRAAEQDGEAARQDLQAALLRVREARARLLAQWRRDGEQIIRYREAIVPETELALDAARGAYATGKTPFSTVIDDFRRWTEARVGLARRQADQYIAWAELRSLLGSRDDDEGAAAKSAAAGEPR